MTTQKQQAKAAYLDFNDLLDRGLIPLNENAVMTIRTALERMASDTHVYVPVEPSDEMMRAARTTERGFWANDGGCESFISYLDAYKAMIKVGAGEEQ